MMPRIASLVPSLTELLFALGLAPYVVARTGFCTEPADAVHQVPKVGGTKDVNFDRLRSLAPSHVLVNADENRLEAVAALREFVPHVLVTHPCAPQDILDMLDQLRVAFGHLPGVIERVSALRCELEAELEMTVALGRPLVKVLYLIWREPWMTVASDTYISRMLARVNWQSCPSVCGGDYGAARYPTLSGDEPWLDEVQRVLLSSEPYNFQDHHLALAQALCPGAVVQRVDGQLLSWYGSRTAAGLRYLRVLTEGKGVSPDGPRVLIA